MGFENPRMSRQRAERKNTVLQRLEQTQISIHATPALATSFPSIIEQRGSKGKCGLNNAEHLSHIVHFFFLKLATKC